uniref:Uncharacterized protein n=1 Tax=Glossina palpalis gambiensis TaxID=67801 RepID=A0A1B0BN88_9MUSC
MRYLSRTYLLASAVLSHLISIDRSVSSTSTLACHIYSGKLNNEEFSIYSTVLVVGILVSSKPMLNHILKCYRNTRCMSLQCTEEKRIVVKPSKNASNKASN